MKKLVFICFLFNFVCSNAVWAQEAKFKALFIYNFSRNIEWPANRQSGNFTIAVLGNSPVITELKSIATKKKIGHQKIETKRYTSVSQISNCHVLYIPINKSNNLPDVLQQVDNSNTLIVTERANLVHKGAGISFMKQGTSLSFQICPANLETHGLKAAQSLYKLGKVVE